MKPIHLLAALLAAVVLVASAATVEPDAEPVATPFFRMKQGEFVECSQAEGCVAMTMEAYHHLLQVSMAKGAEMGCRRGSTL